MKKKRIELHRHLDVSIRLSTLHEIASDRGLIGSNVSLQALSDRLILKTPMSDLASVLGRFGFFQHVYDNPAVLERVAFEAVEDCVSEGLDGVEFRFSPSFVSEKNAMPWSEILSAFESGLTRAKTKFPNFRAGLICIASRDYGLESVEKTVAFFMAHLKNFIGLDLAGNEREFPCRLFEDAFAPARQAGANITVHSGEDSGAENIWDAIRLLGARRIGHGIRCVDDPKLIEYLVEKEICLEICPTSNWITQAVPTLEAHPLRKLLELGVPVTINTDDPAIFGNSMPYEIDIARRNLGLSEAQIEKCFENAEKHTFLGGGAVLV